MKKLVIYFLGIVLIGFCFSSCTPEVIESIDQSKLPQVSGMKVEISVSGKVVTFHSEMDGCVPVWTVSSSVLKKEEIYTKSDFQVTYKKAGTYSVEIKAYNRNGLSDGSIVKEFVLE
mgnify:CR=1 FL=1